MADEKYDAALLAILQSEGKIQPFLDVIFGFLFRRTDFYKILENETGKVGFPVGVAEKLIYNAYKKYQIAATKADADSRNRAQAQKSAKDIVQSDVSHEEVVQNDSGTSALPDDDGQPEKAKRQNPKSHLAEEDSYNGADRDAYSWSQSSTDVDVRIKIPKDVVKAKSVNVIMTHGRLSASCRRHDGSNWEPLLDGQLTYRINLEKSVWTLVPSEYIHVCLEKNDDRWWSALLVDEPEIDVRKIDAHRYLDELPDDEQAKVEELMYDQQQKLLGKPTIQQTKIQEVLKDAWDKEGSPFKGQPFDPSTVNICGLTDQLTSNLTTE